MKKFLSLILVAVMVAGMPAACSSGGETQERLPNLMVMSGPTGVGAAKLLEEYHAGSGSQLLASATVVADNEAVTSALINGEADIAAIATNMAATLYQKLDGDIQVLAVNTMGVLYILEKGSSVSSMEDLRGKTIYATGKGANPEYILEYLLRSNNISADEVDIQWMTPQEVTANMTMATEGICMLPVPAATALMIKDPQVRQAISLSQAWENLGNGPLAQGCIVARKSYVQANPQAVAAFLEAYEASISYIKAEENRAQAAELVAKYGITGNAAIAARAIDQCNLTFVAGQQMKKMLESFFAVMHAANPASIGGGLPEDDFYYGLG